MTRRSGFQVVGVMLAVTLAAGCSMMRRNEAKQTGDLLSAAGFQMKPASTPARTDALVSMPALKMVQRTKDGKIVFTYADPYNCKCLYVGDQQEYNRYKRLALQKQIALEELEGSMVWDDSGMDWGMWGAY